MGGRRRKAIESDLISEGSEDEFNSKREHIQLSNTGETNSDDFTDTEEVFKVEDGSSDGEDIEIVGGSDDSDIGTDDDELEEKLEQFMKHNKNARRELDDGSDDAAGASDGEDGGWGRERETYYVKEDYSDDSDFKDEEIEAKRLQSINLKSLSTGDFIDDQFEEILNSKDNISEDEDDLNEIKTNVGSLSRKEKERLLKKKFPEMEQLMTQYVEASELLVSLNIPLESDSDSISSSVDSEITANESNTKLLLSLYILNLTYYFALDLNRNQEVLDKIMVMKEMVSKNNLLRGGFLASDSDSESGPDEESVGSVVQSEIELEEILEEQDINERSDLASAQESSNDQDFEDVEKYEIIKVKKSALKFDQFGESTILSRPERVEKEARKQNLKFRLSQVDQTLAHKALKESKVISGDGDLAYRSNGKRARDELNDSDDLNGDGNESEDDDNLEDEGSPEESEEEKSDYYTKVKTDKLAKKQAREDFYTDLNAPLVFDTELDPSLPSDTKRKATYKILTNKGLTPHRKKENRNPRVKKRMKYEAALKKLGSVRSVVKDRREVGKYGGEGSGIKRDLAKSTKFQ